MAEIKAWFSEMAAAKECADALREKGYRANASAEHANTVAAPEAGIQNAGMESVFLGHIGESSAAWLTVTCELAEIARVKEIIHSYGGSWREA